MTVETAERQAQQIDMPLTLGQLLKNARIDADLSLQDVADHLRVNDQSIEMIENDDYGVDGLNVFKRGYIRQYAKYVNLTIAQIETYFEAVGVIEKPRQVEPAVFKFKDFSRKRKSLRWLTIGIVVVLIALVAIWGVSQSGNNVATPVSVAGNSPIVQVQTLNQPATTLSQTVQR